MGAHRTMTQRTTFENKGNVHVRDTSGYELDPNRLTEKDLEIVKGQVEDYHKYYELIHYGDLYRITDPWDDAFRCAWEFVSQDKTEALSTQVVMRYQHCPTLFVRFRGLDPQITYVLESTGEEYSGAFLMNAGLNLARYPRGTGESFTLHFVKKGCGGCHHDLRPQKRQNHRRFLEKEDGPQPPGHHERRLRPVPRVRTDRRLPL